MNAREGMQRLRDERRAYRLCAGCGIKLENESAYRNCPECRKRNAAYSRKYEAKRKAEKQ